ncbi:MAG TPA: polysaccharide biosynthesis tyrosine autokinase, partial [Longimicrobiales bacterium]|nr:polysaccharide biosynthesis tyrosine autokinase [Longimicrobiales bacterium]
VADAFRPGEYSITVDAAGRTVDLRTKEGLAVERANVGEPIGRAVGFEWTPPPSELTARRKTAFTVRTPREASRQLDRALNSRMARGNTFMRISYTGEDPERVAGVVNTLATRYVDISADLKRFRTTELRDALESQLVTAQVNLAEAEMALEGFRVATITLPTENATPVAPGIEYTTGPVVNAFFTLKIEREQIDRDRAALERVIANAATDSLSVDAFSVIGAVQSTPELAQALTELTAKRADLRAIRQQYTDEHPTTRRAANDVRVLETTVVPQLARRVIENMDARATTLDDLIGSAGSELQSIPPRAIELARLRRSVAVAEAMYNDLRQRYESARLAAETAMADVTVHDHATVPTRPVSDPRIRLVAMGIMGSLALGVLLALLLDRADPRLRYVEQVTRDMRLQVMGAVPHLPGARRGLLASDESARVMEALRSIRLNLMYAHGSAGPIMVTVSSPGSGDGKTFISSNLALTFADLGMKTLIIDGDTRRGGLHHMYGVDRRPGLTDFLAGTVEADDVVRMTKYDNVSVITGGTRRPDSPELLSSDRLGELLARIRSDYQVIIVDSPPLGAGIDPLVLATLTGNMLLVMRKDRTDRALAEAKLEMLDRMPIRVLGVIMNGLDDTNSYKYYSYLPGYETSTEEESPPQLQPA